MTRTLMMSMVLTSLLSTSALAADGDNKYPLGNGHVLNLKSIEQGPWWERFEVTITKNEDPTAAPVRVPIEEYDSRQEKINSNPEGYLLCSDYDYAKATQLLTCSARTGPEDYYDYTYKLGFSPYSLSLMKIVYTPVDTSRGAGRDKVVFEKKK